MKDNYGRNKVLYHRFFSQIDGMGPFCVDDNVIIYYTIALILVLFLIHKYVEGNISWENCTGNVF
jgi:hypothetical protein